MEFDYSELKRRIKESRFKNCKNFAKAIGHTSTSLSYKLTGRRRFSQDDVLMICRVLNISKTEIGQVFYTLKESSSVMPLAA